VGVRRPAICVRVREVDCGDVHAGPVDRARREEVARHGERGGILLLHRRLLVPPSASLRVARGVLAEHLLLDVRALSLLRRPAPFPSPGVAAVAAGARPEEGRSRDAEAARRAERRQLHDRPLRAGTGTGTGTGSVLCYHARGGRRWVERWRWRRRVRRAAGDVGASMGDQEARGDHGGRIRRGHGLLRHAAHRWQPGITIIQPLPEHRVQRAGRGAVVYPLGASHGQGQQAELGRRARRVGGGVQPRVRGRPAARGGGEDGGRAAVLLRHVHGVRPHLDLLHRAVPDVRA